MACQGCDICEYPTTFGCFDRDYDCDNGCSFCEEEGECKYETGRTGALVQAFNDLVRAGEVSYNPYCKFGNVE